MKKVLIIGVIAILIVIFNNTAYTLPKDSIRFRIIPNSNSVLDQTIKEKLLKNISKKIKKINFSTYLTSKEEINKSISEIDSIIKSTFKENNYNLNYEIKYGMNYFPEKVFKNKVYKKGNYESLVIEIGQSKGSNFWCVLYPEFCIIEEPKKTESNFFIIELLSKLFTS